MFEFEIDYTDTLQQIVTDSGFMMSNLSPAEWAEKRRYMPNNVTGFPGPFSFDRTPYLREIVNRISAHDPARKITVQKGAQIGFSTGVIENAIGYLIDIDPCNMMLMVGNPDLAEEAMDKIDTMISNSGLRHFIGPQDPNRKNKRTGDTIKSKEFPWGKLLVSGPSHKLLQQRSVRVFFADDYDSFVLSSKTDGDTGFLIETRSTSYYNKSKQFYISTPRLKGKSNIERSFREGDQRLYHVPCPCCGEMIPFIWDVEGEIRGRKFKAGITWQLDENNHLISESVGYTCQKCGDFFTDAQKQKLLLAGEWIPTVKASEPNHFSYHISCLYAATGMADWEFYVRRYLKACPPGQEVNETLYQTFLNVDLGELYEEKAVSIKANRLQLNVRNYEIGIVPDNLSQKDGNGPIVLLTLACDLNGFLDDARLDWEVTAWAASGSSYSIKHGSIGTFIPGEGNSKFKVDREHWNYHINSTENSVWPVLVDLIKTAYPMDDGSGRTMNVMLTGVDTGFQKDIVFDFLDQMPLNVIGLRGKDVGKALKLYPNLPNFIHSKERPNKVFLLEVNHIKDTLATRIELPWSYMTDAKQPPGFMNFPSPSEGLYQYANYFSHYEAEERKQQRDAKGKVVGSYWEKKTTKHQNHLFDCKVYNMALKDIWVYMFMKLGGAGGDLKNPTWEDYVELIKTQLL